MIAAMFARLGLDVVADPLPPGDDGTERLLALLPGARDGDLEPGAPGFAPGALAMMDSSPFVGRFGPALGDPAGFPFVGVENIQLNVSPSHWNVQEVYARIRDLLEERSDATDRGFYVPVAVEISWEAFGHSVGVEFVRGAARRAPRIVVYDSAARDGDATEPSSVALLIWGPLAMAAACPRCARAMGWEGPANRDFAAGGVETPGSVEARLRNVARQFALDATEFGFPNECSDLALAASLAGVRRFSPRFPLQAGDDAFCLTWVYVAYELRAGVESYGAAAAAANLFGPEGMRRRLVGLFRRAVRSRQADLFWEERELELPDGSRVSARRFLEWLRWAAELPTFGEQYVAAAPKLGARNA
jgi:hypothetical protein